MTIGAVVVTNDGSLTIQHPDLAECYHSQQGARFEARKLYYESSGIENKFSELNTIHLLDVGLGLAYNALVTIEGWLAAPNPGDFWVTSLENNRQLVDLLLENKAPWVTNWPDQWQEILAILKDVGSGTIQGHLRHTSGSLLTWSILVGDAQETISLCPPLPIDFVWQDPFSPAKAPELWSVSWFKALASRSAQSCQLVTYSVARLVRDSLAEAGWQPVKLKGAGCKKHWLRATLPDSKQP